jgi:redox-sensitive bicupin YhaK (pirin superfamily)
MKLRPANTRGVMKKSWITSLRTFSNNDYWNPKYMNWHCVKVINDDTQQPGGMVPNHEHKNYDILGYVVNGELEHTDSLGNTNNAIGGQVQRMWCGRSLWHTEACVGNTPARYLQIWITPKETDTPPYYELYDRPVEFSPLAIDIKQNIKISCGQLNGQQTWNIEKPAYLYVVAGSVVVDGVVLSEGDGAELDPTQYAVDSTAHLILFELT